MRAIEDFDIEGFLDFGISIDSEKEIIKNTYIKSYPSMIKFFEEKEKISYDDFIVGCHMVYGWMPTILKLGFEEIDELLRVLNKAKTSDVLTKEELELIKVNVNNSIVGGSKLLHFINPNLYPIWDSRVYSNIHIADAYSYRVNNINTYIKYLDLIKSITKHNKISKFHKNIEKGVGYPITSVRAVELVLFMLAVNWD